MSIMNSLKDANKALKNFTRDNKSAILTVIGVGQLLAATALMVKEVPKANEDLDKLHDNLADDGQDHSKGEILVKEACVVGKDYAASILLATSGTICVLSGLRKDVRRIAELSTALQVSESARREFIAKTKEKVGEKVERQIESEILHDKAEAAMPEGPDDYVIYHTGHGDQLYFDAGTGRFFRASQNYLETVVNELSQIVFANTYAGANELAYLLNMPATKYGNYLGWNSKDLMSDSYTKRICMSWDRCYMSSWGEPYAVLDYEIHDRYSE